MKKRTCLVTALLALALSTSVLAADTVGMKNVEYHTADEIVAMYESLHLGATVTPEFTVQPDLTGLTQSGVLTDAVQKNALDTLNFVRYIAGLPYDVTLDDEYIQLTQDASLVMAGNDTLSHYPDHPAGMIDALYNSGYKGAGTSNISCGHSDLAGNIVHGWMADASSVSNLTVVGHRRWIINPTMSQTGFGFVFTEDSMYRSYSAMYAHDMSGDYSAKGVSWPAQTMPVEYFKGDYPWSYSLGQEIKQELNVTLTRQSDGKVWEMNTGNGYQGEGDYALVENGGYGQEGCVIFRPGDVSYQPGDVYHVNIASVAGAVVADYTVEFMSLERKEAPTSGASPWFQEELRAGQDAGYPVDLFDDSYQSDITRADFTYMLAQFYDAKWGIPAGSVSYCFQDLDYYDEARTPYRNFYIGYMSDLGVIQGIDTFTFAPDAPLTREQMSAMMLRMVRIHGDPLIIQDVSTYADYSSISSWALEGMAYMNQSGALNGTDANELLPQGNVTVEQAAVICYRLFEALA